MQSNVINLKFKGKTGNTSNRITYFVVKFNGHISAAIWIHCGIQPGFPYDALCPVPGPANMLVEEHPHDVRIRPGQRKAAVVAYADNVTVLVTTPEHIEVLSTYSEVKGCSHEADNISCMKLVEDNFISRTGKTIPPKNFHNMPDYS